VALAMTREEILAVYAQGPEAVVTLVTMLLERLTHLEVLEARVATLEAQLAKDSHNSGKPPSSDPVRHARSLREPSGKRPGGQPGHEGTTLALRATPDLVLTHTPRQCHACGAPLRPLARDAAGLVAPERRQVFDLTPPRLVVTEHRVADAQCPACGAWTRGRFPPAVRTTAQYGPELQALAVYLTTQQLLPVARASEVLTHLAGQPVSVATVLAAEQRGATALAPVLARLEAGLRRAPVLGVDETGLFVAHRQWWLHTASTPTLTRYAVHPRRGSAAHAAIGILPTFGGIVVHDGYQAFGTAPAPRYPCQHALCGVHLLRELTFLAEEYHLRWAAALKRSLLTMKAAAARARATGRDALDRATRSRYRRRYAALLTEGEATECAQSPPPTRVGSTKGKLKRTPAGRLLVRLRRDGAWVLRFLEDCAVPFDNNEAERDLRMMKVEQKVSGGFRTPAGAHTFATLRSYVVTARKQGCTALDALRALFAGHPFLPAVPE
jgi:transposase